MTLKREKRFLIGNLLVGIVMGVAGLYSLYYTFFLDFTFIGLILGTFGVIIGLLLIISSNKAEWQKEVVLATLTPEGVEHKYKHYDNEVHEVFIPYEDVANILIDGYAVEDLDRLPKKPLFLSIDTEVAEYFDEDELMFSDEDSSALRINLRQVNPKDLKNFIEELKNRL